MKSILFAMAVILSVTFLTGCGSFWKGTGVGAGVGVLGAGAGYEYQANRAMKQIDDDLKNGKITQQEYDIRKDQIRKGSLLQ